MQISKNKTVKTLFALILMLCIIGSTLLVSLPVSNAAVAHTEIATHAFMAVSPSPIGVGQSVFILMWLIEYHPLSGAYNTPGTVWDGYTVTVTAPDGTHTTLGPYTASTASSVGIYYTPTQVGNYTFFFSFPGQQVTSSRYDVYYKPSNTTATITVQQEPIEALPQTPLPTQYWARPINWQNQDWWQISGNYLATMRWDGMLNYNPYEEPPLSAHIMWTKPLTFGGQIGGGYPYNVSDRSNYYTGKSYETYLNPPIIMNGVIFYNERSTAPGYGVHAVDLRSGEELWYDNITRVSFGWLETQHNPNEAGGIAYLWSTGSTWDLYDASTGKYILSVSGATSAGVTGSSTSSAVAVTGPEGELLVYRIQAINATYGTLSMWNSTLCVGSSYWQTNQWMWRPQTGKTIPWASGIQWSKTVPIYSADNSIVNQTQNPAIQWVNSGVILTITGSMSTPQNFEMEAGYSATTGELLWYANRSEAQEPGETSYELASVCASGVYVEFNKATLQYYGFSITTGEKLWGPSAKLPTDPATYNVLGTSDGTVFLSRDISGMYAYYIANGSLAWVYNAPPAGFQIPEVYYPFEGLGPCAAGSGTNRMIFESTGVTHGDQLFRGAQLYAVNATNGQKVWSLDGMFWGGTQLQSADGFVVAYNCYDMQLYSIGKGPSKLTVTAPNVGVTTAAPITITGTVTDICAGSRQDEIAANYPNGLPCVSDDSESDFMAAVYEQQTLPNNVTGVPVTISVVDSNGNYRQIGQTTSNVYGTYSLTWTPDIPGDYTVIANFAGTNSYYGSSGATAFCAASLAPTAAPTEALQTGLATTADLMMYIVVAAIAIIIAIGIVGIVIVNVLKKRP